MTHVTWFRASKSFWEYTTRSNSTFLVLLQEIKATYFGSSTLASTTQRISPRGQLQFSAFILRMQWRILLDLQAMTYWFGIYRRCRCQSVLMLHIVASVRATIQVRCYWALFFCLNNENKATFWIWRWWRTSFGSSCSWSWSAFQSKLINFLLVQSRKTTIQMSVYHQQVEERNRW